MGPQAAAQAKITSEMTLSEKADAIEEHMMHELDKIVTKSVFVQHDRRSCRHGGRRGAAEEIPRQVFQHGRRPAAAADAGEADLARLLQEPARLDQPSAAKRRARASRTATARRWCWPACCTTSRVVGFIRCDHGYWGAQMIAPYVDEEVSEAIRMHQALRFFPDEKYGYAYPDMYKKYFGEDYVAGAVHGSELRRHRPSRSAVHADDRADPARRAAGVRVRLDLRLARALAGVVPGDGARCRPDVEDQARPHGHEPGHARADGARERLRDAARHLERPHDHGHRPRRLRAPLHRPAAGQGRRVRRGAEDDQAVHERRGGDAGTTRSCS